MSEQNQVPNGDDELSVEELESVAGGLAATNENCPCTINNCSPTAREPSVA
jgi:hypothetical protein